MSDEDLAKLPMCICPSCDKIMGSMKSLFGHYGRSHRVAINQEEVRYACPFCDTNTSDGSHCQAFDTKTDLEAHVNENHPRCELLSEFAYESAPKSRGKSQPELQKSTPGKNAASSERRRSSRRQSSTALDANPPSSSTSCQKLPSQQSSLPLCKCPACPKILPPQGLCGHFGRVHSGQLEGQIAKRFEWEQVSYVCPFCPEELQDKSHPNIFGTISLLEHHVEEDHPNCRLTLPNVLTGAANPKSASTPDVVDSMPPSSRATARTSRRERGSRRFSSTNDDGDGDAASSTSTPSPPTGLRKSQRSRRPPPSVINSPGSPVASSTRPKQQCAEEEEWKPLYNCPDCAKQNLSKQGLFSHYGMMHGGKLDLSQIDIINPKPVKKKEKEEEGLTARFGPWSEEEHAAFLEGHQRLGNRWKQIAEEFVPSRVAKQVGSHALNHFTSRGEWLAFGGGTRAEMGGPLGAARNDKKQQVSSEGDISAKDSGRKLRRIKIKLRHSLFGTASSDPMDVGSDEKEDALATGNNRIRDSEGGEDGGSISDNDDGNSSHCIVCFEGGSIVCCSGCPRAYHPKCLSKDGGHGCGGAAAYNVDLLPNDWRCSRCKKDDVVAGGEEISQYQFGSKKIRAAHAEFKDCPDYGSCCTLLTNILDILNKLKSYDYGYVFSEPVDVDDVPNYLDVVKTPMDYGTICERLEGGNYVDLITSDDLSRDDENSTMEDILIHVLCDIERVHHNCRLYNKKGSSIYRIGDVHADKWKAYFDQYVSERLMWNVIRDLSRFRQNCEIELEEANAEKKKKLKEAAEEKKRKLKQAADEENKLQEAAEEKTSLLVEEGTKKNRSLSTDTAPSITTPSKNQKKRKASEGSSARKGKRVKEEDDEENLEDGDGGHEEEEDEEEEEEDEQQPKHKKARRQRQENSSASHPASSSSALIFTEDQVRSLERVFFLPAAKLKEEVDNLDVRNSPTSMVASSPILSNEENTNHNLSASNEVRIDNQGALSGDGGNLTSDESKGGAKDSGENTDTLQPSRKDTSSPGIPKVITSSGPTNELPPPLALPKSASCSTPSGFANDIDDMETFSPDAKTPSSDLAGKTSGFAQDMKVEGAKRGGKHQNQKPGTAFQRQWFDRLDELKRFKVLHGTAVVTATKNDKLYHWRLRQRKRYHLTLFHMPHLKIENHGWVGDGGGILEEEDKHDKKWLLATPEMKGVFSLTAASPEVTVHVPEPFTIEEKDVDSDEKLVGFIRARHQEQIYCPLPPVDLITARQPQQHSSRHSNSLFWDECLEELRFFHGEHGHTLVPRNFPYNSCLSVWVEIQRARYLLQHLGLFSGLTGSQMLVLEQLNICDLNSLSTHNGILAKGGDLGSNELKTPEKGSGSKRGGKTKTKESPSGSPEKKLWSNHLADFRQWYDRLSPEDRLKATELLPRANWQLYSWCWRQCNAAAALLCLTPNLVGVKMSAKKLSALAAASFFHGFPYNERDGLIHEDDYEGSEAFDSTFKVLEDLSIKHGSTLIPSWYDCDEAFRSWVTALEKGMAGFVRGEPCILSARQIEKLILIGFCIDRPGLPNLSKGDVVWLKMLVELKRLHELFGACQVSSDYPRLHQWIEEQKELFQLSRTGKRHAYRVDRLKMLLEAGVDFFTGECLPDSAGSPQDFKEFELLTSSPVERFPAETAASYQTNYGWFQRDSYWKNHECRAKFEQLKTQNGHSIVLANDDEGLYWWYVEKRGKMLLSELQSGESKQGGDSPNSFRSHSVLKFIRAEMDELGSVSGGNGIKYDQSMFLWLHYCERLIMFKAREGHCKIPNDYRDRPLRRWLAQQRQLVHSYSTNHPIDLLPAQLKLLHALGVHGSEMCSTPPKLSSRALRRKCPSRKGRKQHVSDKSKK
ncbi:hypothetical protein ACHAWF_016193 [Thalassiosira exigua]